MLRGVKEPESVASHSYRMAMMAFMFGGGGVDPSVDRERFYRYVEIHSFTIDLVAGAGA